MGNLDRAMRSNFSKGNLPLFQQFNQDRTGHVEHTRYLLRSGAETDDYPRSAINARQTHPAMKATPPIGVIAPSQRAPVKVMR